MASFAFRGLRLAAPSQSRNKKSCRRFAALTAYSTSCAGSSGPRLGSYPHLQPGPPALSCCLAAHISMCCDHLLQLWLPECLKQLQAKIQEQKTSRHWENLRCRSWFCGSQQSI